MWVTRDWPVLDEQAGVSYVGGLSYVPVGYLTGVAAEQVTAAYVSAVAAECAARAAAAALAGWHRA